MNTRAFVALGLALLAVEAGAVEKWGPTWSEVTGNLYLHPTATMHREAAIIRQIDGRYDTSRIVKTEPGKHRVVVEPPMRKGFTGSAATLDLEIAPCKRYYVNAQFKSGTGADWEPVIGYVETIAGCKVPGAS